VHRNRAEEEIGEREGSLDTRAGGNHRWNFSAGRGLYPTEGVDIDVENDHVRSDAARKTCRLSTQGPCAQNHHRRGRDSRRPTDEQPLATELVEEEVGPDGHREAARDLAHRFKHRGMTVVLLDDLVADRRHTAFEQFGEALV
jgi:hypothetical protein